MDSCCACRGKLEYEENVQDAVQALDVALKHSVSLRDDTQVFARAIFWRDDTKVRSLGGGAEVRLSGGALVPCFCIVCRHAAVKRIL